MERNNVNWVIIFIVIGLLITVGYRNYMTGMLVWFIFVIIGYIFIIRDTNIIEDRADKQNKRVNKHIFLK